MNILTRMLGAARLDVNTYEEVEADSSAMRQALLIVVVISILSGLGQYFSGGSDIVDALFIAAFRGLLFWAIWALLIYMIGARFSGLPRRMRIGDKWRGARPSRSLPASC